MYRTVIFDLDGTILDTVEDIADALNEALSECGYPCHNCHEVETMIGNGTDTLIKRALAKVSHSLEDEQKVKKCYLPKYEAHQKTNTKPFEGIVGLIKSLHKENIQLFVYSNKPDFIAKDVVRYYFGDVFADVLGQEKGALPKPDVKGLLTMLQKHKVDLATAIYCGDSDVDVFTARNAGLKCIGVSWGFRPVSELVSAGADFIADKPNDILKICRQGL